MTLKQGKIIKKSKKKKPPTPQRKGEISISGHMAGLESDDNALEAAQRAGLYLDSRPGQAESRGPRPR